MVDLDTDPILKRIRTALDELYGARIERIVLFGSRARGDARLDSDYDIAVFLKPLSNRWDELDRLAELNVALLDEIGASVDAKPYVAGSYLEATSLMNEIRRDGRDLCFRRCRFIS